MRPDGVFIRPYEAEDDPGVHWLYSRTPPAGRVYVRPQPVPDDLANIPGSYDAFWVAIEPTVDGDAVVGITALLRAGIEGPGTPLAPFIDLSLATARLEHVMVVPERQRRGIGRMLVNEAIAWARDDGYETLVLETTSEQEAAVHFYRSLGFQELGRSTFRRWEQVWFGLQL